MAFGAVSGVFDQSLLDITLQTTLMDWDTNTVKIAVMNNAGTPDKTVAAASAAYNTGQWTVASNEVTSSTDIPAGGLTLASKTNVKTTNVVVYSAANTASGAAATATVYGHLCYADSITTPVADQAWCFNSYNATVTVTAGTLTVVHDPTNGIWKITV